MIMKIKLLLLLVLAGGSFSTHAIVRKSDKDIVTSEILEKKKAYATSNVSAADVRRMVEEKRKQRNQKVQAVMKIARDADVPAGLFLESIRDGVVVPELLAESNKKLGAWKERRRAPRELQVPWGNLFGFLILLIALGLMISIRKAKRVRRAEKPTF